MTKDQPTAASPAKLQATVEEMEEKNKQLSLLRAEYAQNISKLEYQYTPITTPIHTVVYRSLQGQEELSMKISWLEKRLVRMEQRRHLFNLEKDMAEAREKLFNSCYKEFELAFEALEEISTHDLNVLRSYEAPPPSVMETARVVMVLRGEEDTSFEAFKVVLTDAYYGNFFIPKLRKRHEQPITDAQWTALQEFCRDLDLSTARVRQASTPGGAMAQWLHALRFYNLAKILTAPEVGALKKTSEEVEAELHEARKSLQDRKEEVAEAEQRLKELKGEVKQKCIQMGSRYDGTMIPIQDLFFESEEQFMKIFVAPLQGRFNRLAK